MTTSSKKRKKVFALCTKQNWLCWICNNPMLPPTGSRSPSRITATLDHINGGLCHVIGRYKAAHYFCNNARHNFNEPPAAA